VSATPSRIRRPDRPRRGASGASAALVALAALCACSTAPALRFEQPVVLLGEVHDNAAQHALRLRAFEAWLASGARPALVMEQFDRERQPAIDRLRERVPPPDADAVIAAGGSTGWAWDFYKPFIALALRHGLPIVAANVSRDDARKVMRDGLQAVGFDPTVPDDVLSVQAQGIEDSHCGQIDSGTARRMALAQVARDQAMARLLDIHADRGVLLLAGNGHVRTDIGVPRWLSPATRGRSEAIGLLERDSAGTDRFDRVLFTDPQPRADPCASLRMPARTPAP
jgi:uncharacterized iron-regulated protein